MSARGAPPLAYQGVAFLLGEPPLSTVSQTAAISLFLNCRGAPKLNAIFILTFARRILFFQNHFFVPQNRPFPNLIAPSHQLTFPYIPYIALLFFGLTVVQSVHSEGNLLQQPEREILHPKTTAFRTCARMPLKSLRRRGAIPLPPPPFPSLYGLLDRRLCHF